MNYDHYNRFADTIRSHVLLLKMIYLLNYIFTAAGFFMYPALLIRLWYSGCLSILILYIIIPGIAFLGVTVFRKLFDARRPYELYAIQPLISREKKGKSFPSRHIFSIMLIGGLWYTVSSTVGIIMLICGAGLAFVRVIGGIHFIKDVIVGSMIGMVTAIIAYFLSITII